MPKATNWPVSGLFGLNKPTNMITMNMLNDFKSLLNSSPVFVPQPVPMFSGSSSNNDKQKSNKKRRQRHGKPNKASTVKMGQGGTLDPLASGVLVVGIGEGTKQLKNFLDCSKVYRATGLLGCSTDSYDSQGKLVRRFKSKHLKREDVERVLDQFKGNIRQIPPIYSALKMDGKPLYEYAREGKPLPRPIDSRECTVSHLSLVDWQEEHKWKYPEEAMEPEMVQKMESLVDAATPDPQTQEEADLEGPGPAFTIEMTVSSGTYVRSIVHDIGAALNSAAHVVILERTRQGAYALDPSAPASTSTPATNDNADDATSSLALKPCLEWSVVQRAIDENRAASEASGEASKIESGDSEWEKAILALLQPGEQTSEE